MTRNEFLRLSAILGIGAPLATALSSCSAEYDLHQQMEVNFSGSVLVIGAGSAGMIAGHALKNHGIEFRVLEASSTFGGRVKEARGFADFPVDLGAEWIHTDPSILARLLSDPDSDADIGIINYSPETLYVWKNDKLRKRNFFTNFYGEYKFLNSTWYDFFASHIVPGIQDRMIFNSPVKAIDYSGDKVRVTTSNNEVYEADKLILTVPLTILKKGMIDFLPGFPAEKTEALKAVDMPDGIKVFMEFSERFYPDLLGFGGVFGLANGSSGERLYYDAAFGKPSDRNILALFTVGDPASVYTNLESEDALMDYILEELDLVFDGKASATYLNHVVQNWSAEPYIQGSYSHYRDESAQSALVSPIDNKIYFAGEAYAEDWATVHGAGESAYRVVEEILAGR